MVVKELMSTNPIVVSVGESVGGAVAKLNEADIRHVPVVESGRLVGIVSDRDLRRLLDSALDVIPGKSQNPLLTRSVAALMSTDVISLHPESGVEEAIDLMIKHKIGAIPVLEPNSLKVIGIISYIDVLRAARSALS